MALNQPRLMPTPQLAEYTLLKDFTITVNNETITIPNGLQYDGASIPAIAWTITYTPFHPMVMCPAICHDWLYANHQVEREVADKIFHQLLLDNGVGSKTAYLMYLGVRAGGGNAYKNKPEDIKYLKELYAQLVQQGADVTKYKFPKEVFQQYKLTIQFDSEQPTISIGIKK